MSSEVFSRVPSVFFVCDGAPNAGGGCTLEFVIDNGGFSGFDKSLIMEENGDPIVKSVHGTYDDETGVIDAGGQFNANMVGMICYIADDGNSVPAFTNPGRYEISAADANSITIESGLYGQEHDADLNVQVGGSFDTISNALDNITANDAGGRHDCYLFTNQNETLAGHTLSGGGNTTYNSKLFITGFNTTLLDMTPGGAYYQSALDAWYDGIDDNCHIKLDLNDAGQFTLACDGIIFQNIRLTKNTAGVVLFFNTNIDAIVFYNCIVDDGNQLIKGNSTNKVICFVHCYLFDAGTNIVTTGGGGVNFYFQGCVADMGEVDNIMVIVTVTGICVMADSLLIGGSKAFASNANWIEWGNTFISHATHTDQVFFGTSTSFIRVGWGDIIVLPQAAEVIGIGSGGGCSLWQGFSALYGSDDAEYTGDYMSNAKSGGNLTVRDFNTIDVDPDFDANYRPRNPQVLRGGPAMLSNGRSQLGAIKQKYQFPQKGRIVNHGRLGILR